MARAMGRSTVAEGVETAEQFHRLRGIGVDAYQGWLFAKALPAAELRAAAGRGPDGHAGERPAGYLTDHARSPLSVVCG